jgi:hypothetical protein
MAIFCPKNGVHLNHQGHEEHDVGKEAKNPLGEQEGMKRQDRHLPAILIGFSW